MAEAGIAIAQARAATVERLSRHWPNAASRRFPRCLAGADRRMASLQPEALRESLAASRIRDAESRPQPGRPATTDLAVRHTAKRAEARDCSTGEQKALLISIILADARELARAKDGMAPILLLDEIAAHLDVVRRAALFEEIHSLKAQAWMTGTDLSLFEAAAGQIFEVRDGVFLPQGDA